MSLPWRVRIPPHHYPGFALLFALTDQEFQRLLDALSIPPPSWSTGRFVSHISESAGLSSADADTITEVLLRLYVLRGDMELPVPEFVTALVHALEGIRREDLRPAGGDWSEVRSRLDSLLRFDDSLGVIAKAAALGGEYDHTFIRAHIVTDLRPVYANDPQARPTTALIRHNLRLSYYDGTGRKEFFVAMEPGDIAELRTQLDRADVKAKSLEALLESTQVRLLKEEGE